MVNKHLLNDLVERGLWNETLKQRNHASQWFQLQHIEKIPADLKITKRFEMSMKRYYRYEIKEGYFIDQSQSLNLFMQDATYAKLTSMHFYAWKSGLKQNVLFKNKAAVDAIKFTLNNDKKSAN